MNIIKALAQSGHHVDLYLWEKDTAVYSSYFPENVRILKLQTCRPDRIIKRKMDWLNHFMKPFIKLELNLNRKYDIVFGLGQIGIYLAELMANKCDARYIYINDEFPSAYGTDYNNYWKKEERETAANACLIIAPDEQRIPLLCSELGVDADKISTAVIPNAIRPSPVVSTINWAERLQLPVGSKPLLHAGSVSDWAQIPEILSSLYYWPADTVLIINSRTPVTQSYKQQIAHLLPVNRVFWTEEPLREDELNSLVSYCMASFSLYRDLGDNIRYVGWSSGKLLRSLVCGRPVIASRLPSLEFVEQHGLGKLVTHPGEIPEAVADIINNQDRYRTNCHDYVKTHLDFKKYWNTACSKIQKVTGIELNLSA